jgi:hypothetical protein
MRVTKTGVLRAVIWIALGVALTVAGVQLLSVPGAIVWGLLLALSATDGVDAINEYRQGHKDGIEYALQEAARRGMLKPKSEWPE